MPQNEEKFYQARNLFFQSDLTQQQICDLIRINRKTLYTWIKEGSWRRAKYAATHAPCVLMEQSYSQLAAINAHIAQRKEQPWPTKDEADIIRKLTLTVKQLRDGKSTASETIQVFSEFVMRLNKENLALSQEVIPYLDNHVKRLLNDPELDNWKKDIFEDIAFEKEYAQWLADQEAGKKDNPGNLHAYSTFRSGDEPDQQPEEETGISANAPYVEEVSGFPEPRTPRTPGEEGEETELRIAREKEEKFVAQLRIEMEEWEKKQDPNRTPAPAQTPPSTHMTNTPDAENRAFRTPKTHNENNRKPLPPQPHEGTGNVSM